MDLDPGHVVIRGDSFVTGEIRPSEGYDSTTLRSKVSMTWGPYVVRVTKHTWDRYS